ncbi:MAG: hypothetical protein K6G83_02150 [Lachnospiraceae bacterium]|nr:hypothetical protein [Lachnospiraceae bacterium]
MKKMMHLFICVWLIMAVTACGDNENGKDKTLNKPAGVKDVLEQGMTETDGSSDTGGQTGADGQNDVSENAPAPETESEVSDEALSAADGIDIDLTTLSSTMVYSEVYNMMVSPDDYIGKTVKMDGQFTQYHDESTGKYYFACIISDATACCSQGIEFVLTDDYTYPDDYPQEGGAICVTGTFDTYQEGDYTYCTLRNARIE